MLIHDDVDNCGQDACAAASEIAKANPGLSVSTIGFGLDKAKLQQMSCVATLTGGKIYDAQNGAGVTAALDQVIKNAHLEAGAPAQAEQSAGPEAQQASPAEAPPALYLPRPRPR